MKRRDDGTERSKPFAIEIGPSWNRWARRRTGAEMKEIQLRLDQLRNGFGQPHVHAGFGLRRLTRRLFEFRISKGIRVVFAFIKPRTFQLAMTGNHDEVRTWLKDNV